MASQGPLYPASGSSVTTFGYPWVNPQNITADDTVGSTNNLPSSVVSDRLYGQSFGFAIPVGATINGIVFQPDWQQDPSNPVLDAEVYLLRSGAPATTNHATSTTLPNALTFVTYGSASDLWGVTWTPAQVNDAMFGAAVSVQSGVGIGNAAVDSFRITVYYTGGAGGGHRNPGMIL